MDTAGLMEIALANAEDDRVEVTALEVAEFATKAVAGLAELILELVTNALSFSAPDDKVRVAGWFEQETYLISISDKGIGIPEDLIGALNRMLEDAGADEHDLETTLGMPFVARLAARHGIAVRLVPGRPGTTARVTVPADLVSRIEGDEPARPEEVPLEQADEDQPVAPTVGSERQQRDFPRGNGNRVPRSREAKAETEAFLEEVFAPLMSGSQEVDRSATLPNGGHGRVGKTSPPVGRETPIAGTALRDRVPGQSFSETEDDSPSTAAGEAAVDIKSALSHFEQGRQSAEQEDRDDRL